VPFSLGRPNAESAAILDGGDGNRRYSESDSPDGVIDSEEIAKLAHSSWLARSGEEDGSVRRKNCLGCDVKPVPKRARSKRINAFDSGGDAASRRRASKRATERFAPTVPYHEVADRRVRSILRTYIG